MRFEEEAAEFGKRVAEQVQTWVAEISDLARGKNPDGSSTGYNAPRAQDPGEALRASALSRLATEIECKPITDARIYALARRQAYVHGDLSEWTADDDARQMIALYGAGPVAANPEQFLNDLAVKAQRATLAHAERRIAELEAEIAATPDERVDKLKAEVKTLQGAGRALTKRLKAADKELAGLNAQNEIKARAAELEAERAQLLEQLVAGVA